MYQARVGASLSTYGLKYEDIIIDRPNTLEAIALSSPDVLVGRNRRVKRAMDLSFKKKDLKVYAPELAKPENLKPFEFQFLPLAERIKKRDEEFDLINKGW